MPDARDELTTIQVGGMTTIDLSLGFFAHTVYIENFTNQYASIPDIVSFVPPFTSRLLALPGVQKAKMLFAAPPGLNQVASIAGQVCNATWSERSVPVTGGPIGPIGVTANYYDRNPLSITKTFLGTLAPHIATVRFSYTVPANRKAFLELAQVTVELVTAYPAGALTVQTMLQVAPLTGPNVNVAVALLLATNTVGARSDIVVGASIELQAQEQLVGFTQDDRAAGGNSFHYLAAKLTEFDA